MQKTEEVSKQQDRAWREQRKQNIAAFLDACRVLSEAIVEHAPEYLLHRARIIAVNLDRGPLAAAAEAVIAAEGAALSESLRDGLPRIDFLPLASWFRSRVEGDSIPHELGPLEELVNGFLKPLSVSYGLPLRPGSTFHHQILCAETWPSRVHTMEMVEYGGEFGFPRRMERPTTVLHPIHRVFHAISEAATWIDHIDQREAQKVEARA